MNADTITDKYQLIDDESVFRLQELEGLAKKKIQSFDKKYHIVSVIGSQSSGKSSLLNAIFKTEFDVLNRKKRVGQTTKGIWYSIDVPTSMIILDVEGSDSNEREERIKIERRNSLFALAVSHTLLINLWIQQIGLYKGSQLAILEIILELNLKLFGSEKPKQIVFVVRDFIAEQENEEALKTKLFSKVQQAWDEIPKPPGKQNIKLEQVFVLKAFFLPSKIQEKDEFYEEVGGLRLYLQKRAAIKQITKDNVPMKDFPLYMQNLWETIEADKDINLPQQKILLSNMKCHQIQKKVYEEFEQEFRDELQKSERRMNEQFNVNIKGIVKRILESYNEQTSSYIKEEVDKIREEFIEFLDRKIELSYSYQIRMISEECLKQFSEEVNKNFIKDKSIDSIKDLIPNVIKKFEGYLEKVSYKKEWSNVEITKFTKAVEDSFENQKERIIIESLKDFDRSIKKQIEGLVSNAFYDKTIFCSNFWGHINTTFKEIEYKAKNSILTLYNKLDLKEKMNTVNSVGGKKISQHVERAKFNAREELKTIIEMKCNDLLYYIMRHFSVDFNMDEKEIPRQWVDMKPEEITALYEKIKMKYIDLLANFRAFDLKEETVEKAGQSERLKYASSIQEGGNNDELMKSKELSSLHKKLDEQMKNSYEEAVKKNKQVYMGSIPTWGWVLFLLVAFDDILLWLHSPYLAIPLTIVLVLVLVLFFYGGKGAVSNIVNVARSTVSSAAAGATSSVASSMLKGD